MLADDDDEERAPPRASLLCSPQRLTSLLFLTWLTSALLFLLHSSAPPPSSLDLSEQPSTFPPPLHSTPLPLTSAHLQSWWEGQALVLSSLSHHITSSLLLLVSSSHSQRPRCSHYQAHGGLFFDSEEQRYWTIAPASSKPLWVTDLAPGDCLVCPDPSACASAASDSSIPQRCLAMCDGDQTTSTSSLRALHCQVCRHTEGSSSHRAGCAAHHAAFSSREEAAAAVQLVDRLTSRHFSLAVPLSFDGSSAFLSSTPLVPSLFFRSLYDDTYQLFRLHDALVARPQHLPLLYPSSFTARSPAHRPTANLSTAFISPPTSLASSSIFSTFPPYSIAIPTVSTFLSSFPLPLTPHLTGGGGGGSGLGYQIRCVDDRGAEEVVVGMGGGGGEGYRMRGGGAWWGGEGWVGEGGVGKGEEGRMEWEGGGGLGAGLQFGLDRERPWRHSVGGGGGGGARVRRQGSRPATMVTSGQQEGGSPDPTIHLPLLSTLVALNHSLATRMRHCLNTGGTVTIAGGGGAGGGQKMRVQLPSAAASSTTLPSTQLTVMMETALRTSFQLDVDLCFLARTLPLHEHCAATRAFPSPASPPPVQPPPPSWRSPTEPPHSSPPVVKAAGRASIGAGFGERLSATVVGCVVESGERVAQVGGGYWESVMCPCLTRGWTSAPGEAAGEEAEWSISDWQSLFAWAC